MDGIDRCIDGGKGMEIEDGNWMKYKEGKEEQ